ncbi:hypothetical protein E4Z66_18310 [Aliishimia ponticola]|uniref:Aspartate carbamoyltransferase catalytic subunit n=1 Tax=Aliishimia ponticola TaxID=2499833 RepID=A0A4V3XJU4_9RHOB|nr:hypothetical protein [Aliishimia ponticola]THH34393.1 hypothetical protein E4Z66_18310 [Aliishimia ponticola]
MSLDVKQNEFGVIRVFALSLPAAEAKTLRDDGPEPDTAAERRAQLLGVRDLNPAYVEVFPVSDLEELGLAGYLVEGNGVDPEELAPHRARLAALDGWVMIVYSQAFGDQAVTLRPAPEATLIATLHQPGTDWRNSQPLESRAATTLAPGKPAPSDAAMSGRIAMAALLVIFLLTALMIWVAT